MNLPDGIKHAVEIGASEFFEWWSVDPSEEELENLGASYQGIGDDAASPADAQRYIADLSAWDDGSVEASTPGAKFEQLSFQAGLEFARAFAAEVANVGTVPARVKPYMNELAPLLLELKQGYADGDLDEDAIDVAGMLWGESDDDDDEDDEDDDDDDE